jgi:hypothetical protein
LLHLFIEANTCWYLFFLPCISISSIPLPIITPYPSTYFSL